MFKLRKPLIVTGIILAILLIVIMGALFMEGVFDGKLPPGTNIVGINMAYKTPAEAKELLEKEVEGYLESEIEIIAGERSKIITMGDIGVEVLIGETVDMVKVVDFKKTPFFTWIKDLVKEKPEIKMIVKVDGEKLKKEINALFHLEPLLPKQAEIYFDENNNLEIKEGEKGLVLNEEALVKDVKESAKNLKPTKLTLIIEKKDPAIKKELLETQKERIMAMINHELVLIDPVYSDDWYFKLADHLDWVELEVKEKEESQDFEEQEIAPVSIVIKKEKLDEFINEEISQWLDLPPENVNIYKDENGQIVIDGRGSNGMEIQREKLKESMEFAVEKKIREVVIPVLEIEPKILATEELEALGIKERIGVGHTSYYGSHTNRIHNIKNGASKFNGTLVAPDEIFSFVKTLGPVDGTTGYRQELVIKAEGTIPEYGGGLCQVSTTMYRAILFSGLPVVERFPHSYAVSYYSQVMGHGLDATIYIGGPDLKFKNDTGHHILIQAYVKDDYELYFVFYGTSDGRSVEMEGPYLSNYHSSGPTIYKETATLAPGVKKQVEISHVGFNAVWYRYITDSAGNVTKETITSAYKAIPAKILVGEGEVAPATTGPTI